MSKLNGLKHAALVSAGAVGGNLNGLEFDWLRTVKGRVGATLNALWIEEFLAVGATQGSFNGMAFEYLGIQGATSQTLNGRWIQFLEGGVTTHQATIGSNSPNFGTGSQFTTPAGLPTPTTFMGLQIAYIGSFGQFFWNARFGGAGNGQPAGVDILRVKMGDAASVDLSWNQSQLRYQGNSGGGESLWTILGDDVGNTVDMNLIDVT